MALLRLGQHATRVLRGRKSGRQWPTISPSLINVRYFKGQEKKKEADENELNARPGEGVRSPLTRCGSHNSLNSMQSSSNSTLGHDNPEQFQSLKHQKDIWEQGIEM